ncbi:MAG: hypothetical protein WCF67_04940 [Chitinophagaceae bacterium]
MEYKRSEMLFKDDYKWSAVQDQDDPQHRRGPEHALVNKEEGYEVLYFINDLASRIFGHSVTLAIYQKLEKMIKDSPGNQTHLQKESWIRATWSRYS